MDRASDPSLRTSPLHVLADKYRPTKMNHDYIRHYWNHLRDIRESAKTVVEIGVQTEKSICMWEEFFPNARIVGIDIDPACQQFSGGRKTIYTGDQMDTDFLEQVVRDCGGGFDVVIDDGLHTQKSILTSFAVLFPTLQPRGWYVIEDILQKPIVLGVFAELMNHNNYFEGDAADWPYKSTFERKTPWLTRHISALAFYRFICFMQRGINPEENPYFLSPDQ